MRDEVFGIARTVHFMWGFAAVGVDSILSMSSFATYLSYPGINNVNFRLRKL